MKIRIFSDLHLEFFDFNPAEVSADVVVLAGDIQNGHYGLGWARKTFPDTAIVYVMGNHEFYDADLDAVLDSIEQVAVGLGITLHVHDLTGDDAHE